MNRTSNVRKQNSSGHFSPKSPDCLPDGSGRHIRIEQKTFAVSEPVTHYRMHTYRPGPPRAVTPMEEEEGAPLQGKTKIISYLHHRFAQ
jgi:hypothetical protein